MIMHTEAKKEVEEAARNASKNFRNNADGTAG